MRYAVISDIHGNCTALKAVLNDAEANGAEGYLLLGDYIRDTPALNDVIDTIRALPNCTAVLGNGDIGVIALDETKPASCGLDQMWPNFWTYHNLTKQNLEYLKSLPETADVRLSGGRTAHLSHSISLISHKPRLDVYHSGSYARMMEKAPFTFDEGMRKMQRAAEECSDEVALYQGDVCLFGHNHLQFTGIVAGKILLDPGSCGLPADYDRRAPYALLDDDGGVVKTELRRVEYDVDSAIESLLEFDGFPYARFWARLHAAALKTASGIPSNRFWMYAREVCGGVFPTRNDLWHKAVTTFEFDHNWSLDDWRKFGEELDAALCPHV